MLRARRCFLLSPAASSANGGVGVGVGVGVTPTTTNAVATIPPPATNNGGTASPPQTSITFIGQKGTYFFTDAAVSVVKQLKNTLVVSKKTPRQQRRAAESLAQLKIATHGRLLRAHSSSGMASWLGFGKRHHSQQQDGSATAGTAGTGGGSSTTTPPPPLPANLARRKWWYGMMPAGYPNSVGPGFGRFFALNIVGCALAAFSLTLATQALLATFFAQGTSVGWLLKDIMPAFVTAYAAHKFINVETYPREWFIVANILTQGAVCFDLAIPGIAKALGPEVLVPLAAFTSFIKGLAMLILTTSRTALVQSFSREGNLIDLQKRLHALLVFVYPTASGVALLIPLCFALSLISTSVLVFLASIATIGVSVAMVRTLYPKLLNTECAVESCRRFLRGTPVVRAAEAPSVALFHRRVFAVPFLVGMSLGKQAALHQRRGESLMVVSLHDVFHKSKYLFVFKKPAPGAAASAASTEGGAQAATTTIESIVADSACGDNSNNLRPENLVGIIYDNGATFSDVVEAILAGINFCEPLSELTSVDSTTTRHRNFLKRPPPASVATLVMQLSAAGWQVRPHQIDNRDLRIQMIATKLTTASSSSQQQQQQQQRPFDEFDDGYAAPASARRRKKKQATKKKKKGKKKSAKTVKKKRVAAKKRKVTTTTKKPVVRSASSPSMKAAVDAAINRVTSKNKQVNSSKPTPKTPARRRPSVFVSAMKQKNVPNSAATGEAADIIAAALKNAARSASK